MEIIACLLSLPLLNVISDLRLAWFAGVQVVLDLAEGQACDVDVAAWVVDAPCVVVDGAPVPSAGLRDHDFLS